MENFIETYSGQAFHFNRPVAEEVHLQDIAHALGNTCRYGGHSREFYSVAEHSVLLTQWAIAMGYDNLNCMTVLLHDAAEAYLTDLPRPIKHQMQAYRDLESEIELAIATKFSTIYPLPKWIKEIDGRITVDERRQVMSASGNPWAVDNLLGLGLTVGFWPPQQAKKDFLTMFHYLNGDHG